MKIVRIGICALVTFCVLAYGVVEVWSTSVMEITAAALLLIWTVHSFRNPEEKIAWNPLCAPLLGLIGLGAFQLLLRTTAYPYLTQTELLKLAAYFVVFFLAAQAFQARKDLQRFVWFLVVLSFAVSLFGIAQHFTSEGKIYWFQSLPEGGDPFGPYVNRNHFAGFVELTAPLGLALMIFRGIRRDLYVLAGVLCVVPLGALILSGSRGGIVAILLAIGVLALLTRTRRNHGSDRPRLAVMGIIALAAVAFIAWLGADQALRRLSTLPSRDVSLQRRESMVHGAERIFVHHPILGCGLGTLVSVFPQYEPAYDGRLVDHVHNDYAELLAEMGILGGICGFIFLGRLFRTARETFEAEQGHFSRALHAGAIASVCALLLHSLVDFNLHIPANTILFLLQALLATSPPQASEGHVQRRRRRVSAAEAVPN
jgi:O-antigen ligase